MLQEHNVFFKTPVIELVDLIIEKAINSYASDIHFESTQKGLRVRLRLDGVLHDYQLIDTALMSQVISRLKVLANINIAEKRIGQDGKFKITYKNHDIDLRVSTFPAIYGEKIVVRILDKMHNTIAMHALGIGDQMLKKLNDLLERPHGFFLVTGPTGSGKTTTLYAALAQLNNAQKNIITLEDPVEYSVDGVTQGQINNEAGFTFSKGIRSILRQDPDILMVGEIRDKETAQTAIEAALTGHLVLSTLHTNDAPSAVMRLMDMAIEPFLINAAVSGVLAQRLARKICAGCKQETVPSDPEKRIMDKLKIHLDTTYMGTGCAACLQTGYKSRTGIFQLLEMTSALRCLIVENPQFDSVYTRATQDGMQSLMHDGLEKVKEGTITLHELVRVAV